jgi:hypothetical protein
MLDAVRQALARLTWRRECQLEQRNQRLESALADVNARSLVLDVRHLEQ